ncbi:MAG: PAS domain-containing protein [Acidobacteriales bacterium]|nr:PAS domain-containing protein [Terriglobales bacterium]
MKVMSGLRSVLVADDSPHDCELYVRYLGEAASRRYTTTLVSMAKEVIAALAEPPDCVLLDLLLPDLNGLEVLKKVKATNRGALPCAFVVVTGAGDEHTGQKAVELGAQDYLIKAEVTPQSLPRSIEFAMARFELEQKLRQNEERYRELAGQSREREERLRMALEAAAMGTWDWDLETGRVKWSETLEHQLGLQPGSFRGDFEAFARLVHPDDREFVERRVRESLETGTEYRVEFRMLCANGTVRWTETRGAVIHDEERRAIRMIGVDTDVTARKRVESALLQARAELEDRVAERTQELQNTLSALAREAETRRLTEERLRELSTSLLKMQDVERRRIARDLHDTTGQTLTVLKLAACALQSKYKQNAEIEAQAFEQVIDLAEMALTEIRTTSYLLHPPQLDEAGFGAAAAWYIDGVQRRSGIAVAFKVETMSTRPCSAVETVLFRVLQESLTNVIRHAKASRVEVALFSQGEDVVLQVTDNGIGIEDERLTQFRLNGAGMGVGLMGMRERVLELGGALDVVADGSGTTVSVKLHRRGRDAESAQQTSVGG